MWACCWLAWSSPLGQVASPALVAVVLLGWSSFQSLPCSFQLTVEMFDYLECELSLFQTGNAPKSGKGLGSLFG